MSLVSAIVRDKKALRESVKATLKALAASDIQAQSQLITKHLFQSSVFHRAKAVSCYLAMPSGEVDSDAIVAGILAADKALYVPKVVHPKASARPQPEMHMLRVYSQADLAAIPPGTWGIREPDWDGPSGRRESALDDPPAPALDVILVPGVAFDAQLKRIGHGKGYYDRFISEAAAHALRHDRPRPLLVALALREQIAAPESIPIEEHDWKVDLLVTPDGIIGEAGGGEAAVLDSAEGTKGGRVSL